MVIPSVREIFNLTELTGMQWAFILGISIIPIIIMEMQKKFEEVMFGKTVYEYKEVRG